jgi:hypothetical protein
MKVETNVYAMLAPKTYSDTSQEQNLFQDEAAKGKQLNEPLFKTTTATAVASI